MIRGELYFENGLESRSVVKSLLKLPVIVRPFYFTENEERIVKTNVLSDERHFDVFLKRNSTLGFFLYTEDRKTEFHIRIGSGYNKVDLFTEIEDYARFIPDIIMCLVNFNPIFGFTCDYTERLHRNRHYKKIDPWSFEHWIGRDLKRYVSGLYWYTLMSDRLLERHGVNLADLITEAISTETLGDGLLHLLKFYDRADEWQQNKHRMDDLCERVHGIFSRRTADDELRYAKNRKEYMDITNRWP